MRRLIFLLFACGASVAAYLVMFGFVVGRPLTIDQINVMVDYKRSYAAAARGPKIFIIAGSNGRYSHSCAILEARLHRNCVNASISIRTGLDWVFGKFQPYMQPGDVVYLPLEYGQYSFTRTYMFTGPDAAYLFRHEKTELQTRGLEGLVRAAFVFDVPILIRSIAEMSMDAVGVQPRLGVVTLNAQGDETGHTDARAKILENYVRSRPYNPPDARTVLDNPDGQQAFIAAFLQWCRQNGVTAIGGLPTIFADQRLPTETVDVLKAFYTHYGAAFVELPNRSQYPRGDFFDTSDHLRERAQIAHSEEIAEALRPFLDLR